MEKVIMDTARTENGYSCECDLLPGWAVAYTGDFEGFKRYVRESVDFLCGRGKKGREALPCGL